MLNSFEISNICLSLSHNTHVGFAFHCYLNSRQGLSFCYFKLVIPMNLTDILIGTDFTQDISSLIHSGAGGSNGETLLYYIEDQSEGADDEYINFVESVITSIDDAIDLDFRRTFDWQEGFYEINLYDKNSDDDVVGKVMTRADSMQIVVFMRDSLDTRSNRNTFVHEFLHGLGLGEPGDDVRFDQVDTALSYNLGRAEKWRNEPSELDLQMLHELWGAEDDSKASGSSPELVVGVGRLYTAAFGRVPDQVGINYWTNLITDNILNYQGVAESFAQSEEFSSRFGSDISDEQFVSSLYSNVLGRVADDGGLGHWVSEIDGGRMNRSGVLIGFADSPENIELYANLVG